MNTAHHHICFIILASLMIFSSEIQAASADNYKIDDDTNKLLDNYCYSCHGTTKQKGDVQLNNLGEIPLKKRLELLNQAQEQIYTNEMPPEGKNSQLNQGDRQKLLSWVSAELERHNASKLNDKLRYYQYGNNVDHVKLFSGEVQDKSFTPARQWLINSYIYNEKINDIFELKERDRKAYFYGAVSPFSSPSHSGVKYYDNNTIDGGMFLTLLKNAKYIVDNQLYTALVKAGEVPSAESEYSKKELSNAGGGRGAEKAWRHKSTRPEFTTIVSNKTTAPDSDIKNAIIAQFNCVLQRNPNSEEMSRYMMLTKECIKKGGNSKGLMGMMISVIMEPEFIYRSEMGSAGSEYSLLTPREASYAISYAFTDVIPDKALVDAANSNQLNSKADFKREVTRLLEDDKIEKPRILRFFKDFFGYENMMNVFKDEERFGSSYNPSQGLVNQFNTKVPGVVIQEADLLIMYIVKRDKDVLKELLTTDKFYVQHNGDNDRAKKEADENAKREEKEWEIYNKLVEMNWKKNPREAFTKLGLFKESKDGKGEGSNNLRFLSRYYGDMAVRYRNGRGVKRVIVPPDKLNSAIRLYNLEPETWSYETTQPFKLDNRMGILTHPAWLVAHSQNAHTDPVVRGKWVREKLLAGFIPEVPITVDATIPEDHHKTLRERLNVTEAAACWGCHKNMNPIGYVFESYDDFGRYRQQESLEHTDNLVKMVEQVTHDKIEKIGVYKTKPVNAKGYLDGTGDAKLDGEVSSAFDLIARLAKSDRVRQSFIRHAFRYFIGRNELLSDSKTLIEADKAYLGSGGSFKALVISLLTSDSFIYRKQTKE